jgi:hypothetical protein
LQAAGLLRNDFIFFIFYSTTLKSTKNNKHSPCRPPQRQGLTAIALKTYALKKTDKKNGTGKTGQKSPFKNA